MQGIISVERQLPWRRPYGNAAGNIFQYESNGVMNMQQFFVTANTRFNKNVFAQPGVLPYGRQH